MSARYLAMAMGVATLSKCRQRHGALVIKHGKVLGSSPNKHRNDARIDYLNASVHAEVAALRKAGYPKRATVVVARINRSGEARLSKPCANCQQLLDDLKCDVLYTTS